MLIHFVWTGLGSVRLGSVQLGFDTVRSGSSPTSRHSSVVRPRVRHAKHGEPRPFPPTHHHNITLVMS
ncbi:hypothetical protein Hanom_Chr05g00437021 [Helianthus anomalus]